LIARGLRRAEHFSPEAYRKKLSELYQRFV